MPARRASSSGLRVARRQDSTLMCAARSTDRCTRAQFRRQEARARCSRSRLGCGRASATSGIGAMRPAAMAASGRCGAWTVARSAIASFTAAPKYAAAGADRRGSAESGSSTLRAAGAAAPAAQSGADPALLRAAPDLPQVACFDTAFHRSSPDVAQTVRATARTLRRRACAVTAFMACPTSIIASGWPHRRAGRGRGRIVVAHLGNGAACVRSRAGGASTARWASPRSTACRWARAAAQLDPGRGPVPDGRAGMDTRAVEKLLYKQSGLHGVSGISSDMRVLAGAPTPGAALRSTCSCIASGASWARWPPRSAGSTPSSSPPASARTPRRCASAIAGRRVARRRPRPGDQPTGGPRITTPAAGSPPGPPDRRGVDDRPPHPARCGRR